MVAAFLKGLLKPQLEYGLRSTLAENIVLEAMGAEIGANQMALAAMIDSAVTGVLKHDARQKHLESVFARVERAHELHLFDVYRLAKKPIKGSVSLYQLYQLMQKRGILDAMRTDLAKLPISRD